jgi:hypothetical protein
MYWISPTDFNSHNELLSFLGSGGFDKVLQGIASISSSRILHLTVFQLSFVVVSYCKNNFFHLDFDQALSGEAWNVMIPLMLVSNSPPELLVKDSVNNDIIHSLKYQYDEAIIFGALTDHSTSPVTYSSGYRVCISASVA